VTYTGGTGWSTFSNSSASGGSYRRSGTVGNTAKFSFSGKGVRWIGITTSSGGIATVKIDGVSIGQVNLYSSSTVWRKTLFERTGLVSGSHTIEIYVTGTKSSPSSGKNIYVDAFERLT
jgi:hypothetical protein